MPSGKKPRAVGIGTIETHVGDSYLVGDCIGEGGSGVVYRATAQTDDVEAPQVAVKFYLIPQQPSAFGTSLQSYWGIEAIDVRTYTSERKALMELRHPGIQRVVGWGAIGDAKVKFANHKGFAPPPGNKAQFLVSGYIDGLNIGSWIQELAKSLHNATAPERHRVRNVVVGCLIDVFRALDYLHRERKHQHSDVRTDNILVDRQTQRPVLIDFGFSQAFSEELLQKVPVTRVPPLKLLNAPEDLESQILKLGQEGQIQREQLRALLFPGLDIYQSGKLLLELLDVHGLQRVVSQLDCELIRLIANDLCQWKTAAATSASDVLGNLQKLVDGYWSGASTPQAPQLSPGAPVRQIALPKGSFLAPRLVERIIETRSFRRLQRLKQLSLLDYVYPGANETRFSHCLSVYSTAVDLVSHLVRSPRFTKVFDTHQTDELLITALLHDINHFPFLHYFQELDLAKNDPIDFFSLFMGSDASGDSPSIKELLQDAGLDPERVVTVLTTRYDDLHDQHLQIIKSIVDSGVDVDKLSYVPGDARATGVPFGLGVDRGALLTGADVFRVPHSDNWHLCFHPRALSAVESLLLARYWNFKQIYWHHTNRALGAMVSHVLRSLAGAGRLNLVDYATATFGKSEFEAIAYLDGLYQKEFGAESILHGLESRRAGLFKRLLSIRAPWPPPASGSGVRRLENIEKLQRMSDAERAAVAHRFAGRLREIFSELESVPLVLLDLPGRHLDTDFFQVHVADVKLDGSAEQEIKSPFIETLRTEFLNLSRTIRLFIPPEVRDQIGKNRIKQSSDRIEKLLSESISDKKSTTVR